MNFDLSTGITAGGAVNVVTRTGSNDFHGSGFFYFRDHNMSAYPYLRRDPLQLDPFFARRQPGFYVGGPIKKDKLFFFSSYEHVNQRGVFSTEPTDTLFAAFLSNAGTPYHSNQFTQRFDYRIKNKHTGFLRYSHDGNDAYSPTDNSQPSNWGVNTNYADSGVFSLISAFTPSVVNEFRYSMTFWDNKKSTPAASICPSPCFGLGGPQFTIHSIGGLQIGNNGNTPTSAVLRRHIFADNITLQKGAHSLKLGGEWEYQQGTGTYAYAEPGGAVLYSPRTSRAITPTLPPLAWERTPLRSPRLSPLTGTFCNCPSPDSRRGSATSTSPRLTTAEMPTTITACIFTRRTPGNCSRISG